MIPAGCGAASKGENSAMRSRRALIEGRNIIAKLAEEEGDIKFAAEVRAGCWDHRRDVIYACGCVVCGVRFQPRQLEKG